MKKIINKQPNGKNCFVCGVENDKGLGAFFYETDTNEVVALFTPESVHQGYPGRLHGGVVASILDETIGRAIQIGSPDTWGVTAELSLSYKKPLPYGQQLKAVARVTKDYRLLFEGEGEIYTQDGEVAVTAKAKFVKMDLTKISSDENTEELKVYLHMDDPTEV